MNIKSLVFAASVLTMVTGGAHAGSLDAAMEHFFMDKEMKTMKSMDEMKAAYKTMSAEDKKMIDDECKNVSSMHATFCQSYKQFN